MTQTQPNPLSGALVIDGPEFQPKEMNEPARAGSSESEGWLAAFRAGDKQVLEACYREHYAQVERAVGRYLQGADRETVIHEVFCRLLDRPEMRAKFDGRAIGAWLCTLAKNQAIDFVRRHNRDVSIDDAPTGSSEPSNLESALDAHRLIRRFQREVLPEKWARVFEARFILQLDQREAASRLGMHRTTLAYQEMRIRSLLKRFLLRLEAA
jgi:RNA polymerase sigma-70 factor (ECF subfamily)